MPRHPLPDTANEVDKRAALREVKKANDEMKRYADAERRRAEWYVKARDAGAMIREIAEVVGCTDEAVTNVINRQKRRAASA